MDRWIDGWVDGRRLNGSLTDGQRLKCGAKYWHILVKKEYLIWSNEYYAQVACVAVPGIAY